MINSYFPNWRSKQPARHFAIVLVGLAVLMAPGSAQAQTPTFAAAVTYGTGTNGMPYDIAVADVNGDGNSDLLIANSSSNTAGVLLGTGTGTFQPVITYATGGIQPYDITVADVNSDGKPDLLTVNYGSSTAAVLLGNGNGTFQTAVTYGTGGSNPTGVTVADVNGDGRLDLLATNSNSASVGVLLGNGNGTFQPAVAYATNGNRPYDVVVADVNGDSNPDLLTANYGGNTASVLLGNGNGTFQTAVTYSAGANSAPTRLAVTDINGDGRPDLLTANYNSNTVGVLLGNSNGTFQAATTYATGGTLPYDIAMGDVNGDGKPDVATANLTGNSVGVLLGTGTGTFLPVTTYNPGGTGTVSIAVADVNADSKPDLLAANYSNNVVGVLLNTTNFTAPILSSISPTSGPVGTSVTITGTNLTGATGVSFNGTAATTFAVVNATTVTATVPAGATSGNVTVTTPIGTSNGVAFAVTVPDLVVSTTTTIAAGTYNNVTVTGTGNGTLAGDVVVNGALVVQDGGILSDGCHLFTGSGTFTLAAGGTLAMCRPRGILAVGDPQGNIGTVRVTGGRSFSNDANYIYNGSDATGSGLPSQVRSLSIVVPGDVALTQPTSVTQTLTLSSTGNLVLGSQALTLLSSATGTALVVNSGTGVVSGTATVRRYLDPSVNPGPGYRHYSAPVSNTTVADLATSSFSPEVSQATAYNASATPGTITPFPTVFGYNQARLPFASTYTPFDRGFYVPADLNAPLVPGQGYAVNIAGTQLVDFNGTLNNGTLPIALSRVAGNADAGWALVGNPYPAPLDFSLVAAADRPNLDAAMYVFESNSQYTGAYRSFVNGVGTSSLIGSSQGFFVRVSAGQTNGAITFRNSQRLTSYATQAPMRRTAADLRPLVQLELRGSTGPADVLFAYAETGASPAFDTQFDAAKLPNSTGLNLAGLATSGEALAIDGRPAFTAATVLPLTVGVPAAGTYTFVAAALNNLPAGLDAYLSDAATGQTISLSRQSAYAFNVTPAQAASALTGRFSLRFGARAALATAPALTAAEVLLYPNPAHESVTVLVPADATALAVQAELLNALGQVVRRQSAATGLRFTVPTQDLAAGVYTLRLTAGTATVARRVVLQ